LDQHILYPIPDHVLHFLQNLHRSSSILNLKEEHIHLSNYLNPSCIMIKIYSRLVKRWWLI
jgi:hypothetical protein